MAHAAHRQNQRSRSLDSCVEPLFDQTRAPSAIGTWLRSFVWATVRMLDAVSRRVVERAWQARLGPDLNADLTVDFDSTTTVCASILA